MNKELIEALNALEKEKKINKETIFTAIENSLYTGCKNHFGKADNFTVKVDRETGDFNISAAKVVVETVEDSVSQISLAEAKMLNASYELGDTVNVEVKSEKLGRIGVQAAKGVITQAIREEEKRVVFDEYYSKEKDIVTGVVKRYAGKNLIINLGRQDAILNESEMVKGEKFKTNDRIKVYVLEVKTDQKGLRILVSRTHPDLVKRLFENEVGEIRTGVVEVKSIRWQFGLRILMLMQLVLA